MFSAEIRRLLVEVITSWQVIAVTVVLVVYMFLVNYVARLYHRRRPRQPPLPGAKPDMPETPAPTDSEELGLEESKEE